MLEAMAAWLAEDPKSMEPVLLAPETTMQIELLFQGQAGASTPESMCQLLCSLLRLLRRSPRFTVRQAVLNDPIPMDVPMLALQLQHVLCPVLLGPLVTLPRAGLALQKQGPRSLLWALEIVACTQPVLHWRQGLSAGWL